MLYRALFVVAGLALAAAPALARLADRLVYFPRPLPEGWTAEGAGISGAAWRELRTRDGVRLTGLWIPREGARATLLYLHGNGGNVTSYAPAMARFAERARASVFVLDYRGYGRSEGAPSEEGLYLDAEAALDDLVARGDARPERLIIYGFSLGTGVATELALRRRAAGLILEAPFTSVPALLEARFPFLDGEDFFETRFDTLAKAPRLALPVLVVHGTADRTIPFSMGRAVAAAAPGAELLEVPGAGHTDCHKKGGARLHEAVDRFVARALARSGARRQF